MKKCKPLINFNILLQVFEEYFLLKKIVIATDALFKYIFCALLLRHFLQQKNCPFCIFRASVPSVAFPKLHSSAVLNYSLDPGQSPGGKSG
jgi:hypothetical protein